MAKRCCGSSSKYGAAMLREPVTFQRKTRTSNGAGGFTEVWATVSGAPTMAYVKAVSGGERWASERVEARATHRVVVRYFEDLTEVDRVVIRDRAHNIRFINNVDFEDKWLEITTEQGVAV